MSLSIRINEEIIKKLDRLAKIENLDRTTIVRQIIAIGLPIRQLDLAIRLYQNGKTLEQAATEAGVSLWDLIDELTKRGISTRWSEEEWMTLVKHRYGDLGLK